MLAIVQLHLAEKENIEKKHHEILKLLNSNECSNLWGGVSKSSRLEVCKHLFG